MAWQWSISIRIFTVTYALPVSCSFFWSFSHQTLKLNIFYC